MINSFWNICSTCPMPKEQKLDTEYKRNYVWHPMYSAVPQDVVTAPPQSYANEMGIQRKKQYPDLAYRTSKVIANEGQQNDSVDSRTRSEERGIPTSPTSGPRSRSAEPSIGRQHQKSVMIQSYPPLASGRGALVSKMEELPSLLEGVIKNTEYRSQFAWPQNYSGRVCMARKSISMGLIKAYDQTDHAQPKSKQEIKFHNPVVKEHQNPEKHTTEKKNKTEYNAKYKPFTSYVYIDGQWKKTSRLLKIPENHPPEMDQRPWYSEVMERLQRANEYKCRGHGHPVYGVTNTYSRQNATTPLIRPKNELAEIHIPSLTSDLKDPKKKEELYKKSADRKMEREKQRSKSAEPRRERKSRPEQRPQTAPPPVKEKKTARPRNTQKPAKPLQTETRQKSMSRTSASRKAKEEVPKTHKKDSRESQNPSAPQGSVGKVWLQPGAPASSSPTGGDNLKGKHSDAVRPSTLLPPKSTPQTSDEKDRVTAKPEEAVLDEKKICASEVSHVSPVPVPLTHVQTPEEVTGVKSPEPENWTVPLDKGQNLEWTESSSAEPQLNQKQWALPEKKVAEKVSENPALSSMKMPGTVGTSAKMTTVDVLDRARSRLDQFWGKK